MDTYGQIFLSKKKFDTVGSAASQHEMRKLSSSIPVRVSVLVLVIVCLTAPRTIALNNGLAQTPPMGWNSWNSFHCKVDHELIVRTAEQIKELKLDELGYRYINIDDCWMSMFRTKHGKLIGDSKRFPKGMKWMGDYLHSQGLLFGIYSSAGYRTCAGYPASLGKEQVDAQTFAEWGVDYLKYDNCFNAGKASIERYAAMRNALNATGRPILYSICQWGTEDSCHWGPSFGNVWRTTGDITADWNSIVGCFWKSQQQYHGQSMSGAWLDPDMLEVGNGDLTYEENKSHFSLWVLAKAPLLLGNDLSTMTSETLEIISNTELLDLHQDPSLPQATCVVGCDKTNWCAPNVDGEHVFQDSDLYLCNRTDMDDDKGKENMAHDDDYSIFATTRRHGSSNNNNDTELVAALIMNWHDSQALNLGILNAVQVLGIAPFPNQRVLIRDAWEHTPVTVPAPLMVKERTTVGEELDDVNNDSIHDKDHNLDRKTRRNNRTNERTLLESTVESSLSERRSFSFQDLQKVPLPPIPPHGCLVYTLTTISNPTRSTEEDDEDRKHFVSESTSTEL